MGSRGRTARAMFAFALFCLPMLDAARAAEPRDELVLHVLEGRTGAPVPDVAVLFVDRRRLDELSSLGRPLSHDPADWPPELVDVFRADARGVVRVPALETGAVVSAEHGSLWGRSTLYRDGSGAATRSLRLYPDRSLELRVVDRDGRPQGDVPVSLRRWLDSNPYAIWTNSRSSGVEPSTGWSGHTDADGTARIPRVSWLVGAERTLATGAFQVTLDVPGLWNQAVVIDPRALTREPVELELDPTGSAVVEVEDSSGRPFEGDVRIRFGTPRTIEEAVEPPARFAQWLSYRGRVAGGRIEIPHVGLGLPCEVELTEQVHPFRRALASGPGPSREGEVVSFTVRFEDGASSDSHLLSWLRELEVVGRAVDPDGHPMAGVELTVESYPSAIEWFGWLPETPRVTTDSDGRFTASIRNARLATDAEKGIRIEHLAREGRDVRPTLVGEVAVPDLGDEPLVDLEDVRLDARLPAVGGRVFDAAGAPAAGVEVQLHRRKRAQFPAMCGNDLFHRSYPTVRVEVPFEGELAARCTSAADGSFAFVEAPTEEGWILSSVRGPMIAPGLAVPEGGGARDLELSLRHRPGPIRGELLLDPHIPARHLSVAAALIESPISVAERQVVHWFPSARSAVAPGGGFELAGLQPGVYTLHVFFSGFRSPVASVERVELPPDGTSAEAEPVAIDLEGRLHLFELRAVDPDGAPVSFATYRFEGQDTGGRSDAIGRIQVLATDRLLLGYVGREDVGAVRVECRPGTRDVVLPGPSDTHLVRLRLEQHSAPDPSRYRLEAGLTRERYAERGLRSCEAELPASAEAAGTDENGDLLFRVLPRQTYRVRWWRVDLATGARHVLRPRPTTIDVGSSFDDQVFEFSW